jgi:hypothetical protein
MFFVDVVQNVGTRKEPDHSNSLTLNVGKILLYLLSVYLQGMLHLFCQYSEPSLLEVEGFDAVQNMRVVQILCVSAIT